jgi:hypothetical protein
MDINSAQYLVGMTLEAAKDDLAAKNIGFSVASTDGVASFQLIESEIPIVYADIVDGVITNIVRVH